MNREKQKYKIQDIQNNPLKRQLTEILFMLGHQSTQGKGEAEPQEKKPL